METIIAGYPIDHQLPKTGVGEVYKAIDPQNNQPVVLKLLPNGIYPALRNYKQLVDELNKLDNPIFVPVRHIKDWNGHILIVMDYMPGGSLTERIKDGPLSSTETSHIIYRLARGLELAHRLEIYHHNIHPNNILFDENGEAFLSDFGMAQLFEANPEASIHFMPGNPLYMSPEQLLGDPNLGARGDIYALGVLYYQMLAGRPPQTDLSPVKAAIQLTVKPFSSERKRIRKIPRKINTTIAKATKTNPQKRYKSASKMAKSFRKWVDEPTIAQLETDLQAAVRFIQQRTQVAREIKSTSDNQLRKFLSFSGTVLFVILMISAGVWLGTQQMGISLASFFQSSENPVSVAPTIHASPTSEPTQTPTIEPEITQTPSPTPSPTSVPPPIIVSTLTPTPAPLIIGGADKIAFLYNSDIWMTNLDGTDEERLTVDGESKSDLVWTNDGEYLMFKRDSVNYEINIETRTEQISRGRDLYENKFCELKKGSLTRYSKDGKTAATIVKTYDENNRIIDVIQVFDLREGCDNAKIIDQFPPGRFEMQGYSKANDSSTIPEYAWDGDQLFVIRGNFRRQMGDMTIYNLKTKTGEVVNPIDGACCYRDFQWSPDGLYLLFTFQDIRTALTTEIFYIQYGTIDSGVVQYPLDLPTFFNFNPNEKLYPALRPHPQEIAQPVVIPEETAEDVGDVVIAGVDKIAIVKNNDIWIFNPDGSGLRQITADGAAKSNLQWTPDGNTILYKQFNCLYGVDITSGVPQRMGCYQTIQLSRSGDKIVVSDYVEFPDALARLRARVTYFNLSALTRFSALSQFDTLGGCPFLEGNLYRWSDQEKIAAVVTNSSQGNRLVDTVSVYKIGDCDEEPILLTRFPENRFELKGFSEPSSKAIIEDFAWNGHNLFAINGDVDDNFGEITIFNIETGKAEIIDPLQIACCYRDMRWNLDGSQFFFSALIGEIKLYFLPFGELKTDREFSPIPLPSGFFADTDPNVRLYPALRPANRPEIFYHSSEPASIIPSSVTISSIRNITTRDKVAYAVDFSPDDSQIVTGSDDQLKLWQLNAGKNIHTFGVGTEVHSEPITSVKFSQDGEWISSASVDNSVRVWRPSTGAAFLNLDNHFPVLDIEYLPGTNYIAITSSDNRLEIRNTKNSGLVQDFVGHTGAVLSVSISADGKILASGSTDHTARVWNVEDGSLIKAIDDHLAPVSDVAISPDGQILATASWDGTIKLWSLPDVTLIATLVKHTNPVTSVAFSPDSQYLLTGSEDHTILLWRMRDQALLWSSAIQNGAILDLVFAHNGETFASALSDGQIILWSFNE